MRNGYELSAQFKCGRQKSKVIEAMVDKHWDTPVTLRLPDTKFVADVQKYGSFFNQRFFLC